MGKKSRTKGKSGEREAAKLLGGERTWWHEHDVRDSGGRFWEIKRVATGFAPAYAALEEYIRHNEESGETGEPIVLARMDRKPWIVFQYYDSWVRENEDNSDGACPQQCCRRED